MTHEGRTSYPYANNALNAILSRIATDDIDVVESREHFQKNQSATVLNTRTNARSHPCNLSWRSGLDQMLESTILGGGKPGKRTR
ncbi:hypothetical protein PoB_002928200 [Plakobranchus ocellatus]|uniref:Uncharacterized protein n=1 Tax=Plakobranchus ocellatus TaxID=259542 RepID=A0AAV4A789_9GAST|nr:hypothetical protein PoB_002928200 [Plakobranchus ocellatus]